MRVLTQSLVGLLASLLLASCGGGGGSGSNTAFTPAGLVVSVSTATSGTTPGSLVGVTVQVRNPNGAAVGDGTTVTLGVSPPGVGLVSSTTNFAIGDQATGTTAGGIATFRFHSRSLGSARLTASVVDPNASARTVTGSATITVGAGPPNDARLSISCVTSTIPVNVLNLDPFIGSPYLSECTITWRNLDGSLVGTGGTVQVSINPVNPTGGFTTLDDPATPDNEFLIRIGQGPVNVVAGKATVFFNSFNLPATATMTVTAIDAQTGETVSAQQTFTIVAGAPNIPASVGVFYGGAPIYIQGSGGNTSAVIQATVVDGNGTAVPNPPAGVDNVLFEIVGGAQAGERLVGISAAGTVISGGGSITVATVNGQATVTYQAGSRIGLVTIRATADRSDNNVDNGIQDPVFGQRGITVSDGKLFDLRISEPVPGETVGSSILDSTTSVLSGTISDLTGDFSTTIRVHAVDRQGNPVVPGTEIKFGLIDFPKVPGSSLFAIAGNDGDPQESGFLFTAPSGQFTTAGGGAGPGDTLVVFGRQSVGNRDLESARTIQSINSATSLNVTYRFNPNDDTGNSVNLGPVIPYVIGRATSGSITQSAVTDGLGNATALMSYPASALGTVAVVWAEGSGVVVNGTAKLVADAGFFRFAGLGPAILSATPESIPGNTTSNVTVCVKDSTGAGLQQIDINFLFADLIGAGSVNGTANTGTITTGSDGCVVAAVKTTGVVSNGGTVVFSALGQSASVKIVISGLILQATPNDFIGDQVANIKLKLIDSGTGAPVNDALILGTCTAPAGTSLTILPPGPGFTGQQQPGYGAAGVNGPGQTDVQVQASGFKCGGNAGSIGPAGSCTFTTVSGEPSAVVTFRSAIDPGFSPPCTGGG